MVHYLNPHDSNRLRHANSFACFIFVFKSINIISVECFPFWADSCWSVVPISGMQPMSRSNSSLAEASIASIFEGVLPSLAVKHWSSHGMLIRSYVIRMEMGVMTPSHCWDLIKWPRDPYLLCIDCHPVVPIISETACFQAVFLMVRKPLLVMVRCYLWWAKSKCSMLQTLICLMIYKNSSKTSISHLKWLTHVKPCFSW